MNLRIIQGITSIAIIAAIASLSGCKCAQRATEEGKHPRTRVEGLRIIREPQGQIAPAGSDVSFTVGAKAYGPQKGQPVHYQWMANGTEIAGATSNSYTVFHVARTNVAMYSAKVWTPEKEVQSMPVPLIMSMTNMGGPGTGSLDTPIGMFTNSGGCCNVNFDKYHPFLPFDGPNTTPPSPDFPNPLNYPKLTIDTFSINNSNVDTCVMIVQSFVPFSVIACNNDSAPPAPITNTRLSTCTGTLANGKKYRVGICYQSGTLQGSTIVTWNWAYHN